MRLLNVKTRQVEEYLKNPPRYAILSHRWGDKEVIFQDIQSGWAPDKHKMSSWLKLEGCCEQAEKDNLSYIWADTCCINKESSRELDEAINSMFNWYRDAATCYVYLPDVHSSNVLSEFCASNWFTRGWTLQELLAPKDVRFYDSMWRLIGTKKDLSSTIEEVTKISSSVLRGRKSLYEASVAQRMSWAANRATTRIEDNAYCLLGLFKVNMDMRYGEGEQAFGRLQLEIMKIHGDHSILAWGFATPHRVKNDRAITPGSALATSPTDFANSNYIVPSSGHEQSAELFDIQGASLRMQLPLVKDSTGRVFGLLNCGPQTYRENIVGIPLHAISTGNYFRPAGSEPSLFPRNRKDKSRLLPWIWKKGSSIVLIRINGSAQVSKSKSMTVQNRFYVDESAAMVRLINVVPRDSWIEDVGAVTASNGTRVQTREKIFLRFQSTRFAADGGCGDDFVVVLMLEPQVTCHVMVLSRGVPLDKFIWKFEDMRYDLRLQQSCSNGQAGLTVSVEQEIIGGQSEFVLKLTKLAENPVVEEKTVNATHQLETLRKRREDVVNPMDRVRGGYPLPSRIRTLGLEESLQVAVPPVYELPVVRDPPGYRFPPPGSQYAHRSRADGGMVRVQFGNPNVERPEQRKAQLIVGVDFNVKFSAVAFAFATKNEAKEDIITEWPGAGHQTKQRIPTVLYYDQYQRVVGWGLETTDALGSLGHPKPGVQKVEWFLLQLNLKSNTYIDPINLPPLPPGKSEIDVSADYLFHLREVIQNQLQKRLGVAEFNREEQNIRYYFTIPANWNDAPKTAIRTAAVQAGFLRNENDDRLTLVAEPEAAAMFCSKIGLLNLKINDAVIIVIGDSNMVELITYEVEDENPFSISECTACSGDSCGSTALNRNFSNILRSKIRKMKLPDGSKTAGKVYSKCIMDFENRIKDDFRNSGQKWAVDVGVDAEYPEADIEEGYMTFTNEEILQCFEPVVNRILELVRNQITAVQAQNRGLQNVLVLFRDFTGCEYVFQQIKLSVPPQYQSKVVRPMDSVAAFVKGAVTAGITEQIITHWVARRHYLIPTLEPFHEGYHPEAYRVQNLNGQDRCKNTRQIFIQKGRRVKIGESIKLSFFQDVPDGLYKQIFYACDDDICPEYTTDPRVKELVTLTADLSQKNLARDFDSVDTREGTFYRAYIDICLTFDGTQLNAELEVKGEVMGRCTVIFR